MEKHNLNIKAIIERAKTIKGLADVAWLLELKRGDEVVLETESKTTEPLFLRVMLIILSEELLKNNPALRTKENQNIDFNQIQVWDYEMLAAVLTKITGVKFSVAIEHTGK
ncbi:MAG: hypothetical protein HY063_09450 [Bacteroidetes bacterium]|nr:hypothetical protein [Bacteroidota bacterium]